MLNQAEENNPIIPLDPIHQHITHLTAGMGGAIKAEQPAPTERGILWHRRAHHEATVHLL
jgi:hypothetical protein